MQDTFADSLRWERRKIKSFDNFSNCAVQLNTHDRKIFLFFPQGTWLSNELNISWCYCIFKGLALLFALLCSTHKIVFCSSMLESIHRACKAYYKNTCLTLIPLAIRSLMPFIRFLSYPWSSITMYGLNTPYHSR